MFPVKSDEFLNEGGVYQIKNLVNGQVYIGVTKNFKQRLSGYKRRIHNAHLRRSVEAHGRDAFEFEPVAVIDCAKERFAMEVALISRLRKRGLCLYNQTDGGEGVVGCRHSPDSVAKRAAAIRGRKNPKLSAAFRGRSAPWVSAAHKGKKHSQAHISKRAASCARPFQWRMAGSEEWIDGVNVAEFCRQNGLYSGSVAAVLRNERTHCKGFEFRRPPSAEDA